MRARPDEARDGHLSVYIGDRDHPPVVFDAHARLRLVEAQS
jgi:hypothetical protein